MLSTQQLENIQTTRRISFNQLGVQNDDEYDDGDDGDDSDFEVDFDKEEN